MLVVLMIFGMAVGGVGASGFGSSKGLLLCPFLGGSSGGSAGCVRACVRVFFGCVSSCFPVYSGSLEPILYGAARLLGKFDGIYSGG